MSVRDERGGRPGRGCACVYFGGTRLCIQLRFLWWASWIWSRYCSFFELQVFSKGREIWTFEELMDLYFIPTFYQSITGIIFSQKIITIGIKI